MCYSFSTQIAIKKVEMTLTFEATRSLWHVFLKKRKPTEFYFKKLAPVMLDSGNSEASSLETQVGAEAMRWRQTFLS